jgi:perosamine synthetase
MPIEGYVETGFTGRMTDIQAALGLAQLGRLDELVARRRELAARYQDALADVPALRTVGDPRHGTTNFQTFWVLLDEWFPFGRDELIDLLASFDIASGPGIRGAHLEPDGARFANRALPITERLTDFSLILPLFHDMTESDQDRVIEVVRRAGH